MSSPFTLYPLQQAGLARSIELNGQIMLMMDPRTGKSVVALEYLLNHEKQERVQILCPDVAVPVWKYFVPKFTDLPLFVMKGRTKQESADRLRRLNPDKGVIIAPLDTAWMEPMRSTLLNFRAPAWLVDEAHLIKGPTAKRSIFARVAMDTYSRDKKPTRYDPGHRKGDRIAPWVDYRMALTGTPIDKYLENLWAPFFFVDPAILGDDYYAFEMRHVVRNPYSHKVLRYLDEEWIRSQVAAHSFQCSYSDMYGEPNVADFAIPVPLTGESKRVHMSIRKNAYATVNGLAVDTGEEYISEVMADTIFSEILRCQQATSGFIKTDDGTLVDIGSDKLKVCVDMVRNFREMDRNIIIFCRFKRDIARLAEALKINLNDTLCGLATERAKDRNITDLQNHRFFERCPVLLAQIQAASMSADMGGAHVCIYYSLDYSLLNFSQSYCRPLGPNQDGRVDYYHLIAECPGGSIDGDIYKALHEGQDIVRLVCKLDYATRLFGNKEEI